MAQWTTIGNSEIQTARRSDAEFFKKEYIDSLAKVRRTSVESLRLLGVEVVSGPFGSTLKSNDYTKEGIPLIRISDLEDFSINRSNLVFISESSHHRIIGSELRQGDLVLSKVGNSIGIVSILDEGFAKANISENNIGIRFRPEVPLLQKHFLLTYLNCRFGQNEILRRRSGNAQPKLNVSDVYGLEVPLIPEVKQQEICEIVRQSQIQLKKSKEMYQKAQEHLEAELGLDKLTFQKSVGYTARFSELEASRRADAEFFHVGYEPFISAAKSYSLGWSPLGNLTSRTLPNFDVRKRSGEFEYIEIGDVSVGNGNYSTTKVKAKNLPANAKIELSGGEILFSQVRPTRGAIAIANDELDHATICSGAFYVCKTKDVSHREIIWLYLRSIRFVFEKYCGGTSYPTIDSRYITKFPVPLFTQDLAQRVQDFVLASKTAKRRSEELLAQAKARVENLIEEAVKL